MLKRNIFVHRICFVLVLWWFFVTINKIIVNAVMSSPILRLICVSKCVITGLQFVKTCVLLPPILMLPYKLHVFHCHRIAPRITAFALLLSATTCAPLPPCCCPRMPPPYWGSRCTNLLTFATNLTLIRLALPGPSVGGRHHLLTSAACRQSMGWCMW